MAGLLCGVPGSNDRLGLTATSAPLGPFPFPANPATPAAGMRHGDDTELSGPVRARGASGRGFRETPPNGLESPKK